MANINSINAQSRTRARISQREYTADDGDGDDDDNDSASNQRQHDATNVRSTDTDAVIYSGIAGTTTLHTNTDAPPPPDTHTHTRNSCSDQQPPVSVAMHRTVCYKCMGSELGWRKHATRNPIVIEAKCVWYTGRVRWIRVQCAVRDLQNSMRARARASTTPMPMCLRLNRGEKRTH